MIPRDVAAGHLLPLAQPTMSAFTEARQHCKRYQDATSGGRAHCSRPALGLMDGVSFWGFFASLLVEKYDSIPNVAKLDFGHPLTHAWNVGSVLCVQLKSDVAALDTEQMIIPGLEGIEAAVPHLVALTWSHAGALRFDPAFVHLTPEGQPWRIPVAALLEQPVTPIPTIVPKPQLSSRNATAQEADTDADTEAR